MTLKTKKWNKKKIYKADTIWWFDTSKGKWRFFTAMRTEVHLSEDLKDWIKEAREE